MLTECEFDCECEHCFSGRSEFCEGHTCVHCCGTDTSSSESEPEENPYITELRVILATINIEQECKGLLGNKIISWIPQEIVDELHNELNIELYFLQQRARDCGCELLDYPHVGGHVLELEKKE